jgi:cytoskeletal protein CcmA (bactofilin family)
VAKESQPGGGKVPDTYEALQAATEESSGLLGRMKGRFQDAIQSGRADNRQYDARAEAAGNPRVTSDDLALRRARHTKPRKMVIPDGVLIEGSLTSGSESEVAGRIDGDLNVDGDLMISPTALISGNVRTVRCRVEGLVDGKLECGDTLDLGESGRLNNDVTVGKRFTVAGQVFGNIICGGELRLVASAKVTGDIHCKKLIIEEGANLNGICTMRAPAQREKAAPPAQKPAGQKPAAADSHQTQQQQQQQQQELLDGGTPAESGAAPKQESPAKP